MSKWLHVVGVTEQGISALDPVSQSLIYAARTIIGPARMIAQFENSRQNLIEWQSPLESMIGQVRQHAGHTTVVLATGDPNWFGIGATLGRHFSNDEFGLHPAVSAFQLAASRLGWPLQSIATLSVHGRPVSALHPHVLPGNRILALASNRDTVHQAADLLIDRGYGQSRLTVLENLGAADEKQTSMTARGAATQTFGDFYVLAIDCLPDADAELLTSIPGLPDAAFQSDGQLTKREVRAATLAKLAPYPGALLWDVGAGSGSIAIEWMRGARDATAICFERDAGRSQLIALNKEQLGVPLLQIVSGTAPESLQGQPQPGAVFIGGGVANEPLFDACWGALKPGGRLVANAVTIDGENALFNRQARLGGELARIDISVLDTIGTERVLRPRIAVTQWLCVKEGRQ